MIYGYWVLTSGVLYPLTGYKHRVTPHPILTVSNEIRNEVQSVMYRNTAFCHAFEMKDYMAGTIGEKYRFAFRMFRNIELTLTPLGWHIHQDEEEKDLPHLLRTLANILATRDNLLETQLKLTFLTRSAISTRFSTNAYFGIDYHKTRSHGLFEPCQKRLPGTDEEQYEELKVAWMRAQFLHLGMPTRRLTPRCSMTTTNLFYSHKLPCDPGGQGSQLCYVEYKRRADWT